MPFNAVAGGGAAITLPWGDDIPDPNATTLNSDIQSGVPLSQIIGDLNNLDPSLSQAVPEPMTLSLFGVALVGVGAVRRKSHV